MGNFEKLSVLVIVVIIVMILVVALYTWTDKPSEDTELAKSSSDTELPIGGGDPLPDPDTPVPDTPVDPDQSNGGETPIEIPVDLPELPKIGEEPEVVRDVPADVVAESDPWIYTFKRGEVLSKVCNRELGSYYKVLPQLKTLNPGVDFDRIREGQQITMPPRNSVPGETPQGGSAEVPQPSSGSTSVPGGEYVVQRGDSLKSIAKRVYGDWTVWPRIYAKNLTKVTNPDYPTPGTKLTLPTR